MTKFDKGFFAEHQKTLLDYLNSPIGNLARRSLWIEDRKHKVLKVTPNAYHVALPDGSVKVTLHACNQHAEAIHKNYKYLWESIHAWDMRFANRYMPAYNLGLDTYTSQPDATAGLDTYIDSNNPTLNSGTDTKLSIGELDSIVATHRTLIKFDFTSIPSNSVSSSVTLSLWLFTDISSNTRSFRVFRTKRDWVEAQATWNIWKTSNSWSTAGGFHVNDCEQTDIGTRSMTSTEASGEKQWSLTSASLDEMWNGTWTNNGFLLKADTESNDAYYFRSSDYATAGERPKLTFTYVSSSPSGFFAFF